MRSILIGIGLYLGNVYRPPVVAISGSDALLLEDGSYFLLEDGSKLLLG